jgi:hypothetical protein
MGLAQKFRKRYDEIGFFLRCGSPDLRPKREDDGPDAPEYLNDEVQMDDDHHIVVVTPTFLELCSKDRVFTKMARSINLLIVICQEIYGIQAPRRSRELDTRLYRDGLKIAKVASEVYQTMFGIDVDAEFKR